MEVIIIILLDVLATPDVLTAFESDVKLGETRTVRAFCMTIKSPSRFERVKKNSTVITLIGTFYHLFAP